MTTLHIAKIAATSAWNVRKKCVPITPSSAHRVNELAWQTTEPSSAAAARVMRSAGRPMVRCSDELTHQRLGIIYMSTVSLSFEHVWSSVSRASSSPSLFRADDRKALSLQSHPARAGLSSSFMRLLFYRTGGVLLDEGGPEPTFIAVILEIMTAGTPRVMIM